MPDYGCQILLAAQMLSLLAIWNVMGIAGARSCHVAYAFDISHAIF